MNEGPETCPRCGSPRIFTMRCTEGPHYAQTGCSDCAAAGRRSHIRWEEAPMTPERAAAFVMPFGKHRGTALHAVPVDYLQWLAARLDDGAVRRAIEEHLRHRED